MEEKSSHHSLKYFFLSTVRLKMKTKAYNSRLYQENTITTELFLFFPSYITWRHEKREGSGEAEGMSSTIWRRREEGVRGSIRMHPTST